MEFKLTSDQELIRRTAREFAEAEIRPVAAELDESREYPRANVSKMAELGFMGMCVPTEYGGAGADVISYALAVEEISRVDAAHGVIMSTHNSLVLWPLNEYGNEEQKRKFLVPLAKGQKIGSFGLTEPDAGSDAAAQRTTAVLDGDEWVINGSKMFITNGGVADVIVVMAMTDKSAGTRGITSFIVEKDSPGFSVGSRIRTMGITASYTAELLFDNCRIPKENQLSPLGKGFVLALRTLDGGRIGIGAQAVGIAQACLDASISYAQQRVQFGKPIASLQAIQWMIADMAANIEAARYLVLRAAYNESNHLPYSKEAAMAKLVASNTAVNAARSAVQIHGGHGYAKEFPVERYYRDAKITEIYEGTSEVMRLVIAANLLQTK